MSLRSRNKQAATPTSGAQRPLDAVLAAGLRLRDAKEVFVPSFQISCISATVCEALLKRIKVLSNN